tara:strand:- start:319 stop:423 length:105 start_codon:yes stop_codon:yes gene_type:complete
MEITIFDPTKNKNKFNAVYASGEGFSAPMICHRN